MLIDKMAHISLLSNYNGSAALWNNFVLKKRETPEMPIRRKCNFWERRSWISI